MAQIDLNNLKRLDKNRNTIHEKVFATYTVFQKDAAKYLQIDTYGKTDRENPEKISQSFQVDRQVAEFLVNLLSSEFDIDA